MNLEFNNHKCPLRWLQKESKLGCVGAMIQGAAKLSSDILPCSAKQSKWELLGLGERVYAILMQSSFLCVFLEILGSRLLVSPACIF